MTNREALVAHLLDTKGHAIVADGYWTDDEITTRPLRDLKVYHHAEHEHDNLSNDDDLRGGVAPHDMHVHVICPDCGEVRTDSKNDDEFGSMDCSGGCGAWFVPGPEDFMVLATPEELGSFNDPDA
jgi:hypothetical protein